MALDTYTNLIQSILAFMGRPGDVNIPVADAIRMAEAEMNRGLMTQDMVTFSDITTVTGTASYSLPSDFNMILEVKITSLNPVVVLQSMGPGELDESFGFTAEGQPCAYNMSGTNMITFGPSPDGVYTIRVRYYAVIPPLTASNQTNWLLTQHPDAYLWVSLRHAETFLGADSSDARIALFEQRAAQALSAIKQSDIRYKTGGTPTRMRTYLRPRDTFP